MSGIKGANQDWGDDDEKKGPKGSKIFKEFDCPDCSANNPVDPPFGPGDELMCNYCGSSFEVRGTSASEGEKATFKLKSK
jgi:hypothetical protein